MRFLLFTGKYYDEQLPWDAFRGQFETEADALKAALANGHDWAQIVDLATLEVVGRTDIGRFTSGHTDLAPLRRAACKHAQTYRVYPPHPTSDTQVQGDIIASGWFTALEPGLYCEACQIRLGD